MKMQYNNEGDDNENDDHIYIYASMHDRGCSGPAYMFGKPFFFLTCSRDCFADSNFLVISFLRRRLFFDKLHIFVAGST